MKMVQDSRFATAKFAHEFVNVSAVAFLGFVSVFGTAAPLLAQDKVAQDKVAQDQPQLLTQNEAIDPNKTLPDGSDRLRAIDPATLSPAPTPSPTVTPSPSPATPPTLTTPLPPTASPGSPMVPLSPPPSGISPAGAKPTSAVLTESERTEPAPEGLNTPVNPLLFPTDKQEVTVKGMRPLTLKQTIELAERNSRELEISRLQVEQQQAAVREANAGRFPTLDLQSSITRQRSANGTISIKASQAEAIANAGGNEQQARQQDALFGGNRVFGRSIADDTTSWNASLQLNYDLFTSGSGAARRKAAAGRLRAAELAMERIREQLRLDVTGDYYDLQEADEQVKINQQAVKNSEQSLKDAKLQERVGLGTKFDVLRSEVQLANNLQQLTNSLATQTVRRRQLAQRLSLPEDVIIVADDPVTPEKLWNLGLEETIVLAYKQRVELEEQLVQRDISEANRKQALSALGPQIQLRASYDLQKIFEQPVSEISSGYSLSAVAQWRLFDGGSARARAQQSEKDGQIAESRFAQSRNAIRFQVEQAYATMKSNQANISTTEKAVRQAQEAFRLAQLRFQAGVGTQTDVINAETDVTRAAGNKITAILGYNRAIAQLRRSVSNVSLTE